MVLWQVLFWAGLAIVLIVLELTTSQLISIWFGLSAAVVFGISFTGINFTSQMIIFGILSAILIIVTRPITKKMMANKSVKTNADSLVGCECVVLIDVSHEIGGRVSVSGKEWAARTGDDVTDTIFTQGQKCIIEDIKGVNLIVKGIS